MSTQFPECPVCKVGKLVPLSSMVKKDDQWHVVTYSNWVCTNPECSFAIHAHGFQDTIYYKGGKKFNSEKSKKEGIF